MKNINDGLFEGLHVLELAGVLAGPAAGMFFAELGAKVTKVENKKTKGDVTRTWKVEDEKTPEGISSYYCSVNYKKHIVMADLSKSHDLQQIHQFVSTADVIITNFKTNDDKKFKLDFDFCRSLNEKVIYVSLKGFPSSDRVAYDAVLQAETGYVSINGFDDRPGVKMPVAMIDILAAHQIKEAVLCALLNLHKTGKGSLIELDLYNSALSGLANQATDYLMNGNTPKRLGSLHPSIAPYGETFVTSDGKNFLLAIGSDQQFRTLCQILESSALAENDDYKTNEARVRNREALKIKLSEVFRDLESAKLFDQFLESNIPFGEIKDLKQVLETRQAKEMILTEMINGVCTKRMAQTAFKIYTN